MTTISHGIPIDDSVCRCRIASVATRIAAPTAAGIAGVMPVTKAGPSSTHTAAATVKRIGSGGCGIVGST